MGTRIEQSSKNDNIAYTSRRQTNQKHNTICVGHHYAQTNTDNINKTRETGSKNCISSQIYDFVYSSVTSFYERYILEYNDALCSKFWTKMELIAFHSLNLLVRWTGIHAHIDIRYLVLKHIYYEHIFEF